MPSNAGKRSTVRPLSVALGLVLTAGPAWTALGQAGPDLGAGLRPVQPADQDGAGRDQTAEATLLREQLRSRIEMSRQAQSRMERALVELDQGTPPGRVRQDLERDLRPMLREMIGLRGRDGGVLRARGDGDRPPMRGPEGGGGPPLLPGDRGRIIEFIERENPSLAEQLRAARRESPEAADRMVDRLGLQVRQVLGERDPAARELRLRDLRNGWALLAAQRSLTEAFRAGLPEDEIRARTLRLRELLEQRYDLQLEVVNADIASLEQRLGRLREEAVERSAEGKEAFVSERIERSVSAAREAAARGSERTPRGGEGRRGVGDRGPR